MGKRELDAASARLCRTGNRTGEADATCGSSQTHVYSWIGGVDDQQGALDQARATCPHLVAEYTTEQSSSTVEQFAQTILLRSDSRKEPSCMQVHVYLEAGALRSKRNRNFLLVFTHIWLCCKKSPRNPMATNSLITFISRSPHNQPSHH